jgi:hypothetical protein
MPNISIISLIYKSTRFADAVYDSIVKYTPLIEGWQAEFFFVANDADDRVIKHIQGRGIKCVIQNNDRKTDEELFGMGIGWPEYISRVYKGWNRAILEAQDIVVLVNSDCLFSPGWLENLLKHARQDRVVCSQLFERKHPKYGIFPGAYHGEFGNHPDNFNEDEFLQAARNVSRPILRQGGAYMPCLFYKDIALNAGMYPEGNIAGKNFNHIVRYGDEDFFLRLAMLGVSHVTAMDSIVYHFKEGEMEDIGV